MFYLAAKNVTVMYGYYSCLYFTDEEAGRSRIGDKIITHNYIK